MTKLVAPVGGRLVDLCVPKAERPEIRERAVSLPSVTLPERALCDLELLATGAFSPLDRFLGRADHERVREDMRLRDGTLWPIPILLTVPDGFPLRLEADIALRDPGGEILAVMTVEEAFPFDAEREARALLGRGDPAHSLMAEMRTWGGTAVSGRLRVIALPTRYDFRELRATPAETRAALEALGHDTVVAFQTRNPLHRSHEELLRRAQERVGGTLLVHPAVGLTSPGDLDYVTRVRACRALLDKRFDPRRTLLRLLPLAMRMAGPREALWHALVRRNYGASHFVVGRDHAGPGPDSAGRPFFGPYDAQELARRHEAELGVKVVCSRELVYLPDQDRYEEEDRVPPATRVARLSGTDIRARLARGESLPEWFTRPEVAEVLRSAFPPEFEGGVCIWFTGLPASGKSSTASALAALLGERGRRVTVLDGDVVRTHLSKGLGFSREDRDTNVLRIGFVAAEVVRHRGVAICAAVSPYRQTRDRCRALVGAGRFVEVFMSTPLRLCEERDPKGLYARARRGEAAGVTGVDDPYEPPERPEVVLTTAGSSVIDNARLVVDALVARGDLRR